MTDHTEAYFTAASSAVTLLANPAVAAAWTEPSALADMTVGGLAVHLAGQVTGLPPLLTGAPATEQVVRVLDHYDRAAWINSGHDSEANTGIRRNGETGAADGPEALVARTESALTMLRGVLATTPGDRPMRMPFWGPYSLTLDDFLTTRMMEIAVHSDDLAASVDVATPDLPHEVVDTVVDLLSRLAVLRHGPTAVLRALTRAERAPATIAAF
ncbi:MAG: hypothetical protein GEU96_03315 [Propionibacteriales bacterium]|nr:hypothetical protein [Propionibacteriales bacterium]